MNFAAEKASILYDTGIASSADLIQAVEKAGYKAMPADSEDSKAQAKDSNRKYPTSGISFI